MVGKDSARVTKVPLLHSSEYSKALPSPVRLHFSMLKAPADKNTFQQKNLVLALLLEGQFESVFKNRVASSFTDSLDSLGFPTKDVSAFAKMIVIPDGDVIKNDVSRTGGDLPLGYYQYTGQTFTNKDFILNCIEYLVDDIRLIETRNRQVDLRLLDMERVKKETTMWQVINVAAPLGAIALFGVIFSWIRRRRYAGQG
jgi:ABC-2 type transport system permease protein